jgi:cell division protease FtsH
VADATPPRAPKSRRARLFDAAPVVVLVAVLITINILVVALVPTTVREERVTIPYSPTFLGQLRAGNVASIDATGDTIQGKLRAKVSLPGERGPVQTTLFSTQVPTFANAERLSALLARQRVEINARPPEEGRSFFETLVISVLPALVIVGVLLLVLRRAGGGTGGGLLGFGRSTARRSSAEEQKITFADVAGIDEAKEELAQIVDFLRDPDRYRRLGARIPRGVLLTGPPGTGKTLLARALAGEARVPFFSISASEFVELYVGVGAARVRSLFADAKAAAPAIVFVDELDAIGRSRTAGPVQGGHDEREQTLNQLLTELDGFDPSIDVIVLAATNRPEILDPALLRPGRFDRRIAIQPPDTAGRRQILDVHVRSVPLADDVDLDRLAAQTAGMVGADLANVINEGALLAARREDPAVTMADLQDALEKLVLGSERHILLSDTERRRTAYHEAGHAIVGMLLPSADPVRKVSIIPRGDALGATLSAPDADRFSYDRTYLDAKLRVALGGRVAEELVFDSVTTGAENDIRQVTELARHMVGQWGMSDRIGPLFVVDPDRAAAGLHADGSEETARIVDEEVHRIVEDALDDVRDLLYAHREQLDALALALLEHETLDGDAAHAAARIQPQTDTETRPST